MKKSKIISMITAAAAAVSMLQAFPASADTYITIMGDMNGDLKITSIDAQMALEIYADAIVGNAENTANAENGSADIDMNGVIDVTDAQSILLYYCQTLVGDQPLWAEFREVSYHDGQDYQGSAPFTLKGMYLEIGCAKGAPGETVTVPVYLAGITDLIGFQMSVMPPEGLTPVSISSPIEEDFPTRSEKIDTKPTFNPECGAMVWADAWNIEIENGYIIANYTYTIPEDAESGQTYPLCLDAASTMFIAETDVDNGDTFILEPYQYTLLNGVVVVE